MVAVVILVWLVLALVSWAFIYGATVDDDNEEGEV